VDDEILLRRAITYALRKRLECVSIEGPQSRSTRHETTFTSSSSMSDDRRTDSSLHPIRALAANKIPRVVFVTSLTDFKSRARSNPQWRYGPDAKPFMFIELSVKALTYVFAASWADTSKNVAPPKCPIRAGSTRSTAYHLSLGQSRIGTVSKECLERSLPRSMCP